MKLFVCPSRSSWQEVAAVWLLLLLFSSWFEGVSQEWLKTAYTADLSPAVLRGRILLSSLHMIASCPNTMHWKDLPFPRCALSICWTFVGYRCVGSFLSFLFCPFLCFCPDVNNMLFWLRQLCNNFQVRSWDTLIFCLFVFHFAQDDFGYTEILRFHINFGFFF